MTKNILTAFFLLLIVASCKQCDKKEIDANKLENIDSLKDVQLDIPDNTMNDVIRNLSSPAEMAVFLKALSVPYSSQYLKPTLIFDPITDQSKRAIALGLLGADLAYLTVYNNNALAINHLNTMKKIAGDLQVGHFFADYQKENEPLMFVSISIFNQIDSYLREKKRDNISALIITGLWLESIYHATKAINKFPKKDLIDRIGEQKLIVSELLLILRNFKKDLYIEALCKELEEIKTVFEPVKISYTVCEPDTIIQNDSLIIVQSETSNVEVLPEQLKKIVQIINLKRNSILK